jgi:hypothetical protein
MPEPNPPVTAEEVLLTRMENLAQLAVELHLDIDVSHLRDEALRSLRREQSSQ